MCVTLDEVTRI